MANSKKQPKQKKVDEKAFKAAFATPGPNTPVKPVKDSEGNTRYWPTRRGA